MVSILLIVSGISAPVMAVCFLMLFRGLKLNQRGCFYGTVIAVLFTTIMFYRRKVTDPIPSAVKGTIPLVEKCVFDETANFEQTITLPSNYSFSVPEYETNDTKIFWTMRMFYWLSESASTAFFTILSMLIIVLTSKIFSAMNYDEAEVAEMPFQRATSLRACVRNSFLQASNYEYKSKSRFASPVLFSDDLESCDSSDQSLYFYNS